MALPYSDTPVIQLVDGGYLSWSHGALGFKSWVNARKSFSMRSGTLICLDSHTSFRKQFEPGYKLHRVAKRAKRSEVHERVVFFQSYLREDPMLRVWEVPGFEADDLISVLVPRYSIPVTAIDKDLLQIPQISICRLDGSSVEISRFAQRKPKAIQGIINTSKDVLLTLVLMGDKSDDIFRLIPPRALPMFQHIMNSPSPWKVAYQIFKKQLLHNLYLAVLPGPWCFQPVPSPKKVLDLLIADQWPPWGKLAGQFQEYLTGQEQAKILGKFLR